MPRQKYPRVIPDWILYVGAGGVSVIAKHVKWKVYSVTIFYIADLIIHSHFQIVAFSPSYDCN